MKLNFKEWSLILDTLYNKSEEIESNLRYYDEEGETRNRYLRKQETVSALIAKIESFTI